MSGQKPPQREFVIRVPKNNEDKRFSILKFNESLNIDSVNWFNGQVRMCRQDNKKEVMAGIVEQDYGEGSIYGRAAREEARRKKYGRRRKEYEHDNQPWLLTINDDGKERKLRSICEGGAGEFADYWVFLKAGNDFQAQKITNWYQFLPCITHKTLDSEQAEEKFQLRNKVMNQFALKAQIMQQLKEKDEEQTLLTKNSALLIKDEMSSDDDDDDEVDNDGKRKKTKKKNLSEKRKSKKQRVDNPDEVAAYESEDGQDEGREYDYMSDSGSDTDQDEKTIDEKVSEALVAVGDESGLKSLIEHSDLDTSSDEEDDEDKDNLLDTDNIKKTTLTKSDQKKQQNDGDDTYQTNKLDYNKEEDEDSSNSDSDDPDNAILNSVIFMQRKDVRKRSAEDNVSEEPSNLGNSFSNALSTCDNEQSKRQKLEETGNEMPLTPLAAHAATEAIEEEIVRRLLLRKSYTTKELLNKMTAELEKINPSIPPSKKADNVAKLALILKKIEPYRFRQKVDNKEVLYFSLNQTG